MNTYVKTIEGDTAYGLHEHNDVGSMLFRDNSPSSASSKKSSKKQAHPKKRTRHPASESQACLKRKIAKTTEAEAKAPEWSSDKKTAQVYKTVSRSMRAVAAESTEYDYVYFTWLSKSSNQRNTRSSSVLLQSTQSNDLERNAC
jgi:hypothetical protein